MLSNAALGIAQAAPILPRVLPVAGRRADLPPARIACVTTHDRAQGVVKALELLGINPTEGKQVLVKPNWNTSDPTPGSTHNDTLSALAQWLKLRGADRISVGDRSYEGARSVMSRLGIYDMADDLGFEAISFNDLPADPQNWELVQPASSHWQHGFAVARPVLDAEAVLTTCCLKTHQYGGQITMSLKNSVGVVAKTGAAGSGLVNFMNELHGSPHMRRMIAEINTAYTPDIVVLNGVEAFTSGGPMTGARANTEVILAGTDRVALDAVGVAILRKFGTTPEVSAGRIFEIEQIARAVELGLGVDRAEAIEFMTDDPASAAYAVEIRDILLEQG
jgi:uncharacterized protein (DUF362 family)